MVRILISVAFERMSFWKDARLRGRVLFWSKCKTVVHLFETCRLLEEIRYQVFFIWVFLYKHSQFTGQQGKEEAISLTPLHH